MGLAILGIGTASPDTLLSQEDAYILGRALCRPTPQQDVRLRAIYEGTGIRTRRGVLGADLIRDVREGTRHSDSVFLPSDAADDRGPTTGRRMQFYAESAPPLAVRAAADGIRRAGTPAADVTHLVVVSCTGFAAPGVDLALITELGLPATVQRTHVGYMGCHGAINGLRVAAAFAASDPAARILLCAVELCRLHCFYGWDTAKVIANALFADGAAVVVGAPADAAPSGAWRVEATGSCLIPDSADAMSWSVGDHGFEMTLGRQAPRFIAVHLRPWLEAWLTRHGVALDAVGSWAVHPGGPRILDAVEEGLGLPRTALETSRAVLRDHGNM